MSLACAFQSLDAIFQFTQKARTVIFAETGMMGLAARRQFAQMARKLPHSQRHADSLGRERLAIRPDHPRPFVQAARRQGNIGGDGNVAGRDMLHDPIVGGVGAFSYGDMAQQRIGRWAQSAIADNGDCRARPPGAVAGRPLSFIYPRSAGR